MIASLGIPIRLVDSMTFQNWPVYDESTHDKVLKEMRDEMNEKLLDMKLNLIGTDVSYSQLANCWKNFESVGKIIKLRKTEYDGP